MKPSEIESALIVAAVVGAAFVAYKTWAKVSAGAASVADAAISAAKEVGAAINPTSPDNLAYRAANAVTRAVSGNPTQTFGGAIYDLINPSQAALANQFVTEFYTSPEGWRYFSNGTVIAPNGDYYKDGVLVKPAIPLGSTAAQVKLHNDINLIPGV